MGRARARIASVSAASPLQRLYACHAVLALSMAILRIVTSSEEWTDAKGAPFESSIAGRALALALLLASLAALVIAVRESWLQRRRWPVWLLGVLLLAALARSGKVELADLAYAGTALCALAADRWQRR